MKKRRRKTYINFAKIYEIFPGQDTSILCQLSELEEILPSSVYQLVPEASAVQIAAFLQLAENEQRAQKEKRGESAEVLEKGELPEQREPV